MILLLSVLTGMIFIVTKTLNMMLSKEVGIYKSNVTNHVMGLFGATLFVLIFLNGSTFTLSQLGKVGIFPLVGGILGATFVALSNHTFSKTKVLISTLLILVGQTVASVFLDYIIRDQMISMKSVVGVLLVIAAVFLYSSKEQVTQ